MRMEKIGYVYTTDRQWKVNPVVYISAEDAGNAAQAAGHKVYWIGEVYSDDDQPIIQTTAEMFEESKFSYSIADGNLSLFLCMRKNTFFVPFATAFSLTLRVRDQDEQRLETRLFLVDLDSLQKVELE